MTAYNTIADSDIDPESPITTTLMTRLRDNAIAIAEGTSPAPPVAMTALETYPFTQTDIVDEAVTYAKITNADYTTSTDYFLAAVNGSNGVGGTIKYGTIIAPVRGQFNARLTVSVGASGSARVYKNGSPYGTSRGTGTFNEDLAFEATDKIQLYISTTTGTTTATLNLFAINSPAAAKDL